MMKMTDKITKALTAVREKKPLVHHITNYVTVNDCANICLAIGGSPIMADAIDEAVDIVSISSSLVINMGTLNQRTVKSMIAAGIKANECGIPVIFDPVGAGASAFRNETAICLLEKIKFSVIRGNLSELRFLTEHHSGTKGVDVSDEDMSCDAELLVKRCAEKLGCIIACTGEIDVISDGKRTVFIDNGHKMLSEVTGTGCMCTTLIGAFCGANNDMFISAIGGVLGMGIAGELAFEKSGSLGLGSFRVSLVDEISKLDAASWKGRANLDEKED